jgi:hypothetical protein
MFGEIARRSGLHCLASLMVGPRKGGKNPAMAAEFSKASSGNRLVGAQTQSIGGVPQDRGDFVA